MLEISFACIGVLIVVCILLAVRVNHLERTAESAEKRLDSAETGLSALEEKVSEAYETVEAQAKKEKLLFDGINSIMDYDIGVARKAVSGDARD